MNYLFTSVGRRVELMKDFRASINKGSRIIATDLSPYAPALYLADKQYIVPRIDDPAYFDVILDICKKEEVSVITTLIDPEIVLLSQNRTRFSDVRVEVLAPYEETAEICFDKFKMYQYLESKGIRTPRTWGTFSDIYLALRNGVVSLPIFVKPRTGSGSVGAQKIDNIETLKDVFEQDESLIAQELMTGKGAFDLDADVYIDTISHEPVSVFAKKKISTTIGGANKTISFKDEKLFSFIEESLKVFRFNGPIDADFFYKDGEYYLSEINPRFGGAYLHAYGAGVDFIKLIENNLKGKANEKRIGDYEEGIVMMMYDSVIFGKDTNGSLLETM